jgi:hypothetical protein
MTDKEKQCYLNWNEILNVFDVIYKERINNKEIMLNKMTIRIRIKQKIN